MMKEIMGTEIYDGMRLGHIWHELMRLHEIIRKEKPVWFVEVGIHEGGLTYNLLQEFNFNYVGIEINCNIIKPKVRALVNSKDNASITCGDCFSNHTLAYIRALAGKKIVYCDGGNKAEELIAYAGTVVKGDLLMAHDYSDYQRNVIGFPDYATSVSPEVVPSDVVFLRSGYSEVYEKLLQNTRIFAVRKL